jgi:hypothetical protein
LLPAVAAVVQVAQMLFQIMVQTLQETHMVVVVLEVEMEQLVAQEAEPHNMLTTCQAAVAAVAAL